MDAVPDRRDHRVLIPAMTEGPRPPVGDILSLGGETMGTTWTVRLVAPVGADAARFEAAIRQELDAVVAVFSPWEPTSEISRFNAAPPGVWALSSPFWALLEAALDIADDTNGAVDPTLGALVDLWGFGPTGPRAGDDPIPSEDDVVTALAVSGWQKLRLNREARGAMQMGGMKLDFSGIAKGHAVDRVSERLTVLGATSHLVEIGGELRGAGVKPDAQPWWVEIEHPPHLDAVGAAIPRTVVALHDLAVATSGDYRRYFVADGRLHSHTLDGATGRPVDSGLASVTVLHPSAMKADAFATALMVLGPDDGHEFAEAMGLPAHFIQRTEGGPIERMSSAYRAMMDDEAA